MGWRDNSWPSGDARGPWCRIGSVLNPTDMYRAPDSDGPGSYRVADERVAWNKLAGQVLILELEESRYFRLNRAGSVLWEHLASAPVPVSRRQLASVLVEVFGIAQEQADADVGVFLDRMGSFGLLEA
jgi:hypothetical protein